MSSGELEKYEYLTGEDLGYNPKVPEKVKFQYSPLGEALKNNAKCKPDKIVEKDKEISTWFIINNIALQNLKISVTLKKCHLILCIKDLRIFVKNLLTLKVLTHKQK